MAEPERMGAFEVLAELGITIEPELMDRALTHRSYAYEQGGLPTNERLEFLGDSVLGLVVTEHLFTSYPEMSEGQLAKLRAAVVNSRALAEVARKLDLGSLIKLGRGELTTGGRDKSSILADTTEAVIGAVFVQNGIDSARRFVHHLFDPVMAQVATLGAGLDWKTSLQELCSLNGLPAPQYAVEEDGPDHAKNFTAQVILDGDSYGPGEGRNKKEAEQKAAAIAFAAVRERFPLDGVAATATTNLATNGAVNGVPDAATKAPSGTPIEDGAEVESAGDPDGESADPAVTVRDSGAGAS